jgi:hypothetical protein
MGHTHFGTFEFANSIRPFFGTMDEYIFLVCGSLDKLLGKYCIFSVNAKNGGIQQLVPKTRFMNQSPILDKITSL